MKGKYKALRALLPADVLKIGTLVVFPDDPLRSFFKPADLTPSVEVIANNAQEYDSRSAEGNNSFSLPQIISAGCALKSTTSVNLEIASSVVQVMLNYDDEFARLCKTKAARDWFEQQLERYGAKKLRLHYVIGIQTIKDASLTLKNEKSAAATVKGDVPLAQLLGDPGVLSKLLNPSLEASMNVADVRNQKFSVAEAVYGVRYGIVKFEYRSSRTLARLLGKLDFNAAKLETSTRWEITGADAGAESEDYDGGEPVDDQEDMVEATLEVDD